MNSKPSIQDVASRAGVSLGTVSNVLNNPERVRQGTLEKVLAAIQELGFVPNDAARTLKSGRSRALGIVVLDSTNPFFAQVVTSAQQRAELDGYSVLVGNSGHDLQRQDNYLRMFTEQRLGGVLLSAVGDAERAIAQLKALGTHGVLVDSAAPQESCCSVSVDDVAGGALATQHLIDSGCQDIAFVGGPLSISQVADRFQGAQQAAEAAGATLRYLPAKQQDVISGREVGKEILSLGDKRPDAVFAANDLLAVGLLQAFAMQADLKVPGDIALIGYDDIDFTQATIVPLSTIRQPADLLGQTAIELLLDEIQNPDHQHRRVMFQPELVIRESTR